MNIPNYCAYQISSYFLLTGYKEDIEVNPMKLIILLYISQGLYLCHKSIRLFEEDIDMLYYGPNISNIYHIYKIYGNNCIWKTQKEIEKITPTMSNRLSLDTDTVEFLDEIWKNFKDWTPVQLSNWAVDKDGPWYKNLGIKSKLDDSDLIGFFKKYINTKNTMCTSFQEILQMLEKGKSIFESGYLHTLGQMRKEGLVEVDLFEDGTALVRKIQ